MRGLVDSSSGAAPAAAAERAPRRSDLTTPMGDATPSERLDRAGLEALYVRLEKPLFNVVYRWVWDREEALDLVQEAFVRLWNKRADIDPTTVEALAYRIALNLASNRRRSKKLWRWVSLEALWDRATAEPPDDERVSAREQQRALRAAIDGLPEKLRRVIVLCELSELSHQEIGEALGIPPGTVGSRRHRALALLRAQLEPDENA